MLLSRAIVDEGIDEKAALERIKRPKQRGESQEE